MSSQQESLSFAPKLVSSNLKNSKVDTGIPVSASHKRLLLIEDNDLNRHLLDDYLVFCGYQVLSLPDGSEFFEAIDKFQPHLILLDLKLPDIDGYTLLEQFNQKSNYKNIPIIVVSALAFKADKQRAFNLGIRRYLVKPVNLSDLQETIKEELLEKV